MIPAEHLALITAAVDGELSAPQSRALRQLLATSSEAHGLYAKLRADRERVRRLPQVPPPADLPAKVLARIAGATPVPRAKPSVKPAAQTQPLAQPAQATPRQSVPFPRGPSRVPTWAPVALAASVLLGITVGSFAYFNNQNATRGSSAKNPWSNALPVQQDAPAAVPSPAAAPAQEPGRSDPNSHARLPWVPVPHDPVRTGPAIELAVAPEPRPAHSPLLGSPLLPPLRPFEFVPARVPFLRTVAELDREDIRQELSDDLTRDVAFRLDLFVRDTARGVEVFRNAAKVLALTVFVDAATLDKLQKRQIASVVIYTENLTAPELAALLATVSLEDAKFSPRVCDSLHAAPIIRADEYELKQVLGLDPGLFKRALGSNNSGTIGGSGQGGKSGKTADPKPISADTVDSVVKSVTQPGAKGEKTAVLMTWQTTHPSIPRTLPAASTELKQFLTKRTDRNPSAVPAIIVIRPLG